MIRYFTGNQCNSTIISAILRPEPATKKLLQPPTTTTPSTASSKLINLSSFSLAKQHTSLLTKGPKFAPVTTPRTDFKSDLTDFTRKVKIRDVSWDQEYNDESIHRNKSNRPIFTQNHEVNNICNLIEILQPDQKQVEDNLREEERT